MVPPAGLGPAAAGKGGAVEAMGMDRGGEGGGPTSSSGGGSTAQRPRGSFLVPAVALGTAAGVAAAAAIFVYGRPLDPADLAASIFEVRREVCVCVGGLEGYWVERACRHFSHLPPSLPHARCQAGVNFGQLVESSDVGGLCANLCGGVASWCPGCDSECPKVAVGPGGPLYPCRCVCRFRLAERGGERKRGMIQKCPPLCRRAHPTEPPPLAIEVKLSPPFFTAFLAPPPWRHQGCPLVEGLAPADACSGCAGLADSCADVAGQGCAAACQVGRRQGTRAARRPARWVSVRGPEFRGGLPGLYFRTGGWQGGWLNCRY